MRPKRDCNVGHRNIPNILFKNLYESYRNVNGYKNQSTKQGSTADL